MSVPDRRHRRAALAVVAVLLVTGCTTGEGPPAEDAGTPAPPPAASSPTAADTPATSPTPPLPRFRAAAAVADVRLLAGRIGPRLATGPAFRRAGGLVGARLADLGYDVRRQWFRVPAGDSWGVPVAAGRSFNVAATPPGFNPAKPHRLVGAHLDTVAVAPGAEDNASGVAVLLELARLAAGSETTLPTVFVAFGGEEPRGPGDAQHHFGSRTYVAGMSPAQRRTLRAMVSLDRVGVGRSVPVCTGPLSPDRVQRRILTMALLMEIPAHDCELTTSDHWSFEKAGFAVARLGSTPYPAYHSAADLPRVVRRDQLARTGRLAWAWLSEPAAG